MRRIGNPYLRVGIVGAGLMGDWHAARFARLPVKVLGFYDVSPERAAKAVAEHEHGGRAFDSLDALLDAVDVVDVCTPTPHHREPVLAAAGEPDAPDRRSLLPRARSLFRLLGVG
jgi:predicted dehydrogenase